MCIRSRSSGCRVEAEHTHLVRRLSRPGPDDQCCRGCVAMLLEANHKSPCSGAQDSDAVSPFRRHLSYAELLWQPING